MIFEKLKLGNKIYIFGEKKPYIVKAVDEKYAICVKNMFGNAWYFIINREKRIRGANDRLFNPYEYLNQEGINKCMIDLHSGKCKISDRNVCPLETYIDKEV